MRTRIAKVAFKVLASFVNTFLCKRTLSSLVEIKTNKRTGLHVKLV